MPRIHLTLFIEAPAERVFDLSRSIDLHSKSMIHTQEKAISGTVSGLIKLNETVTWRAKHLGKMRVLQSKITAFDRPSCFIDEMQSGDFTMLKHEHHFKSVQNGTLLIDVIEFETPYGILGQLLNKFYLTRYMKKLIENRNLILKEYAESNKWKAVLM